jgi:hypothetical protein
MIAGWPDAKPTPDLLRRWFGPPWTTANVGLVLASSGLLVIDPDTPEALEEVRVLGLPATLTRQSRMPAYLYRRPEGCPTTTATRTGRSGKVDVLASGQLIVHGRHATGCAVHLDDTPLADAPAWAVAMLERAVVKRDVGAVHLPEALPTPPDVATIGVSRRIQELIATGFVKGDGYPSRSEALFAVEVALVRSGYDDPLIAAIVLAHPIGEKAMAQGLEWLADDLARARASVRDGDPTPPPPYDNDGPPPFDDDAPPPDDPAPSSPGVEDSTPTPAGKSAPAPARVATRPAPTPRPTPKPPEPEPLTSWLDLAKTLDPVTWHWERWLAPGFVHLLASKSGLGKSALALRIAACYMRGDPWPGENAFTAEQGAVLWLESENAQPLNLDRAKRWNLPLDRLINPFGDPMAELRLADRRHRKAIAERAALPNVRLVVLDSLSGAWAGRDENDAAVLELMKWFAGLARDTKKPFLVTHHLRKRGKDDPEGELDLDMLRGSSAVVQVARLVWALDRPNKADPLLRLQVLKSNLARFPTPLGMAIDDDGRVIFAGDAPARPTKEGQEQAAERFLLKVLGPGPVAMTDIEQQAAKAALPIRTLRRAKDALVVESVKLAGRWYWRLPSAEEEEHGLPGF